MTKTPVFPAPDYAYFKQEFIHFGNLPVQWCHNPI